MRRSQLDAMLAESGLAGAEAQELSAALSPLAAISDAVVPEPSAELALLFVEASPRSALAERRPMPRQGRAHRTRGTVAGVVVLAVAGVGATGMSAAANTLPSAWQHQVAGFSRHYLPFDFPEPANRPGKPAQGAAGAGGAPVRGTDAARRAGLDEATRSGAREDVAGDDTPPWRRLYPGSSSIRDPHPRNAAGPASTRSGQGAPVETESAPGTRPGRGAHGAQPGQEHSGAPRGPGKDESPKKGNGGDGAGHSDRPVRGGGAGGMKEGEKPPQKAPQKGPQKGPPPSQPGGGAGTGDPGQGQPGADPGAGAGGPGGAEGPRDPGGQGSAGNEGEPAGKHDPPGPAGDALPKLAHDLLAG